MSKTDQQQSDSTICLKMYDKVTRKSHYLEF